MKEPLAAESAALRNVMTDPISGNFDKNQLPKYNKAVDTADSSPETPKAGLSDIDRTEKKASPQSTVSISAETRKNTEEAVFNREKVEQIREAIRNNSYPLDNKKMAESFVPLEKLINN